MLEVRIIRRPNIVLALFGTRKVFSHLFFLMDSMFSNFCAIEKAVLQENFTHLSIYELSLKQSKICIRNFDCSRLLTCSHIVHTFNEIIVRSY